MAKRVEQIIIGIDTSKDALDCFRSDTGQCQRIDNTPTAITVWLQQLPVAVAIAIEATNTYHERLLEQAMAAGHSVYLIDAKQLHHYRLAVGGRAKTAARDAQLLARYLAHEHAQLKPLQPLNAAHRRLWRLLKRRAALVQARQQLQQACLAGDTISSATAVELKANCNARRETDSTAGHMRRGRKWVMSYLSLSSVDDDPGVFEADVDNVL